MKISRKSWHYKIAYLGGFELGYFTLCDYFWLLVAKMLLIIAVTSVFSLGIFALIISPFLISNIIAVAFIILSTALPLLSIFYLRFKFGKPFGKDNILQKYWSAKKRKICPIIEYVN